MYVKAAIQGDLERVLAAKSDAIKKELKGSLTDAAQFLKQSLRDQVTGAGFGSRLAKTWRADVYPNRAGVTSFRAAAEVRSKAPNIIKAFDEGTTIRSKGGFWLAIPTPAAPKRGIGNKRITPSNFPENRFGRLRFVYRRGQSALLVADAVRIGKSGRVGRRLKNSGLTKSGKLRKGVTSVPMFILVPRVKLPKRFNVAGAAGRATSKLVADIVARLESIDA